MKISVIHLVKPQALVLAADEEIQNRFWRKRSMNTSDGPKINFRDGDCSLYHCVPISEFSFREKGPQKTGNSLSLNLCRGVDLYGTENGLRWSRKCVSWTLNFEGDN